MEIETIEKPTDSEIIEMQRLYVPNKIWEKAFKYYNSDINNRKLHIGCRSCFPKVMLYILQKRLSNGD